MLSEHSQSIPVSLLRQYCFCPRIPYFNETLSLNPSNRSWQQQGLDYHQRQQMLNKRRNLSRYGLEGGRLEQNISLYSAALQLHGICDAAIVTDHEVIALEFKISRETPRMGHKLQLCAYAMMLESHFRRASRRGFILYGERGHTYELAITEALQDKVLGIRDAIQATQASALIPNSSASAAQCGQCEYLNFCADRDC